jgi:ABC-type lipoprotein release transport system permease subunit
LRTLLDVTTFLTAVLMVVEISMIASRLPAHRAMRVDPVVALRSE